MVGGISQVAFYDKESGIIGRAKEISINRTSKGVAYIGSLTLVLESLGRNLFEISTPICENMYELGAYSLWLSASMFIINNWGRYVLNPTSEEIAKKLSLDSSIYLSRKQVLCDKIKDLESEINIK